MSVYFVYNLTVVFTSFLLKIISFFNPKIRLFTAGRKRSFSILKENIQLEDKVIWIHAASLGEYEQGLPVMEGIRENYPTYKILLTFFSPSGYEVRKETKAADVVCYLPLDTQRQVQEFLKLANPIIAIFIKYEIWPNYLRNLHYEQIPTLLISAIFKKDQIYFKWYGGFMRKALHQVSYFFVQNGASKELLHSIGLNNIAVSGDTRFDRVAKIKERNNTLNFMELFNNGKSCFIAGSTWPEDEELLIPLINSSDDSVKFVIAPHNIKKDHIENLRKQITKNVVCYSDYKAAELASKDVLIIDAIGLLTKIYSYASLAYVGGGFATGLHNTLEPAVFGIPVIIGPNYSGFREAIDLVGLKGIFVINNAAELNDKAWALLRDSEQSRVAGNINMEYLIENKGASIQIIAHIRTLL